jgi:hypothetical protein
MATEWTQGFENTNREFPMGLLAVVGIALGVVTLAYLVDHPYLIDHPYSPLVRRAEIIGVVALSGGVAASAYRLTKSSYTTPDLWAIFGWSVAGLLGSIGVASGIYLHQVVKSGELAEPMFLFEELALIGLVPGSASGSHIGRRARTTPEWAPGGRTWRMSRQTDTCTDTSTFGQL